jgi:hypothetical protein
LYLLNFSHPITPTQLTQIDDFLAKSETSTRLKVEQVINTPVQVDLYHLAENPLEKQAEKFAEACALSSDEWQTVPLLVNLPGLSPIAACLLAEIEGRSGHLPSIGVMRPVAGAPVTQYELSAIINLQFLRSEARIRRQPADLSGE